MKQRFKRRQLSRATNERRRLLRQSGAALHGNMRGLGCHLVAGDSARKAGMADVAVEVLHGVGNALSSANTSVQLIHGRVADSKVKTLTRVVHLLDDHKHDLAAFLAHDPRGQKVAPMLAMLDGALTGEHEALLAELAHLRANIDSVGAAVRELEVTAEDKGLAIVESPHAILAAATAAIAERAAREQVALAADHDELPGAKVDKHKAITILAGLLANALDALDGAPAREVRVGLRAGPGTVEFQVTDSGAGIAAENLTRIFGGGFSTKPERRGANLHKFANFATSAGGRLTAHSDGPGHGATFTLVLPDRGAPAAG